MRANTHQADRNADATPPFAAEDNDGDRDKLSLLQFAHSDRIHWQWFLVGTPSMIPAGSIRVEVYQTGRMCVDRMAQLALAAEPRDYTRESSGAKW